MGLQGLKGSCALVPSFVTSRCQFDTNEAGKGRLSDRTGDGMAPKRRTTDGGASDKRKARQNGTDTPASTGAQRPDQARRFVDVDPWAMLLEGLTEAPEEDAPAGREGGNRG